MQDIGGGGSTPTTSNPPSSNQTGGSGVNGTWSLGDYTNMPSQVTPPMVANPMNDPDAFGADYPNNNNPPPPSNINPLGGVRYSGGGGGGGGPAPAGMDQKSWDAYWKKRNSYQPGQYEYDPYEWQNMEYEDQVAPDFYDWDPSLYNTTREGITTGIGNARTAAGSALDRSAEAYGGMGNAYAQGPQTFNQGVDPRLQASMQAFGGAGADAAMQNQMEGAVADAGFGSFYDLMAKGTDQYNSAMVNSVNGDRAAMEQNLGSQEAMMNLQVNMAEKAAKSQYDKDLWAHGKEYADKNYDKNLQIALMNNQGHNAANIANSQGANQAKQANVLSGNQFNQASLEAFLEMIGLGINGAGSQTLDLTNGPTFI